MSSTFIYLQNLIQRVSFYLNNFKKFVIILTIYSSILQQILAASTISMPELRLYNIQRQEYDSFAEHYLLPEDFELAYITPTKRPNAHELDAILNKELFEGDILGIDPISGALLNEDKFYSDLIKQKEINEEEALFGTPYYSALNTQTYADKLWADARVPYVLEQGMSPTQRASIASAFDEYKGKTCIRFVPRQEADPDFIYIKRNNAFGCSSYVGRAGGNQTVSLEVDKCFSKGIIAHELMHALGFFHEHSRTDRDDFVEIQEENIRPGMLRNFEKYPRKIIDPLSMPYDYDSVMHYHKLAFSRNGRSTIVPKKRDAEIGQRYKLSEIDSLKVNKLYRCSDAKRIETTTAETTTGTTEATTIEITTQGDEQSTDETETTTESSPPSTTTSSTSEETITVDEREERVEEETTTEGTDEETEETTTEINEKQKIRTGARERQGPSKEIGLLPGGLARKFITLSIWSTRGRTDGDRKSFGRKNKGMTKIEDKISNECIDLNAHCEMWEKLGHCVHSTKYMNHYCRKSCGFCDREERSEIDSAKSKCTDKNHFCSYWARNGECDEGSRFMKLFCERSCGFC